MIQKIASHGRHSHIRITGEPALRLWRAIYRAKRFTDRGSFWTWAEVGGVIRVWISTDDPSENDLLRAITHNVPIRITIGL